MSDWDSRDYGLLTAALAGVHEDMESTKRFLKRGGEETNPLLGRRPSDADVNLAAMLAAVGGTAISTQMDDALRRMGLGAWAGLEWGLAKQNDASKGKAPKDLGQVLMNGPLVDAAAGALIGYGLNKLGDDDTSITAKMDQVQDEKGKPKPEVSVGVTHRF